MTWLSGEWELTGLIRKDGEERSVIKQVQWPRGAMLELSGNGTGTLWMEYSESIQWGYEREGNGRIYFSIRIGGETMYMYTSRDPEDTLCYGRLVLETDNENLWRSYGFRAGIALLYSRTE